MRTLIVAVVVSLWGFCFLTSDAAAQPLREVLKDIETADHWIYDDLPKAIAEAKETKKPLLVVLRCVPCPPGRKLDEQVMQPSADLAEIEKQFVCVRVVQTNGLDLSVFQYDYDMSWAAMFMNADMTVYGRYGTRTSSGPGSDAILTKAAFTKAAERALALHKGYPANKGQLAAKTGKAPEFRRPEETPGLTDMPAKATTRQNCIHCHMVKEFALRHKWETGKLTADDLFIFPMPNLIGLALDTEDGLAVKSVEDNSPAAKAGIEPGDALVSLGGQPLTSTADVQWVLSGVRRQTDLPVKLKRGDRVLDKTLSVSGDWSAADIGWRASSWYGLRQGVKFEPLSAAEKKSRGLEDGQLALVLSRMYGKGGPKVQQAGLRMGDVIVSVNGKTEGMTESAFLAYMRLEHGPKDSLKLVVLRGNERKEFTVPLW